MNKKSSKYAFLFNFLFHLNLTNTLLKNLRIDLLTPIKYNI